MTRRPFIETKRPKPRPTTRPAESWAGEPPPPPPAAPVDPATWLHPALKTPHGFASLLHLESEKKP